MHWASWKQKKLFSWQLVKRRDKRFRHGISTTMCQHIAGFQAASATRTFSYHQHLLVSDTYMRNGLEPMTFRMGNSVANETCTHPKSEKFVPEDHDVKKHDYVIISFKGTGRCPLEFFPVSHCLPSGEKPRRWWQIEVAHLVFILECKVLLWSSRPAIKLFFVTRVQRESEPDIWSRASRCVNPWEQRQA